MKIGVGVEMTRAGKTRIALKDILVGRSVVLFRVSEHDSLVPKTEKNHSGDDQRGKGNRNGGISLIRMYTTELKLADEPQTDSKGNGRSAQRRPW